MREYGKLGYIGIKIMVPVAYDVILKANPAKLLFVHNHLLLLLQFC